MLSRGGWLLALVSLVVPAKTDERLATLEVEIELQGRWAPVYLAVVAENRRWREPTYETVLLEPRPQTWKLAPGRYRLVGASPEHAINYGQPIELRPGADFHQILRLQALHRISGRVVDKDGRPIPQARVGRLRAFVDDFDLQLSPLGESHLRPSWLATTDSHGEFSLPMLAGYGHMLWVEADGYGPSFSPDVRPSQEGKPLADFVLSPGASLVVRLTSTASTNELHLVPVLQNPDPVVPISVLRAVWERQLNAGKINWPALSSGRYQLHLKGPRRGSHNVTPKVVAEVDLAPGEQRLLELTLPTLPPSFDNQQPPSAPALELLALEHPAGELAGLELLRWHNGRPHVVIATAVSVSGGTRLDIAGGCVPGSTYVLTTDRWFGVTNRLQSENCNSTIRLQLHPRATVTGLLRPPVGSSLPSWGEIEVKRCADPNERSNEAAAVLGRVPFAIDNGRFEVPLPAGCVSLVAAVGDFAKHRWAEQQLKTKARHKLSSAVLSYGGAVLARVISGSDGRPVVGVRVAVLPAESLPEPGRTLAGGLGHAQLVDGLTGGEGWARLFGLPANDYVLSLLTDERHLPHLTMPFTVHAGEEVVLDNVVLPPPASLQVDVELADPLAVEAELLQVIAQPLTARPPISLSAPIAGRSALFDELPPGRWYLQGLIALPGVGQFVAGDQEIEVRQGEENHVTLTLDGGIFEGRVTYLDLPVFGIVAFTPTEKLSGRHSRIRTHTDEDGRFRLPLQPGIYQVEVSDESGILSRVTVPRVELRPEERDVEIRVPAGRIVGKVIDDHGAGIARSEVQAHFFAGESGSELEAHPTGIATRIRTDEEGNFQLEGMAPGQWQLYATAGEERSEPKWILLPSADIVDNVHLRIPTSTEVSGYLLNHVGQPIVGARGKLFLLPSNNSPLGVDKSWTTDTSGRFTYRTDRTLVRGANLAIASDQGVFALRTDAHEGMIVRLPPAGGDVILRINEHRWGGRFGPHVYLVAGDGGFLRVGFAGVVEPEDVVGWSRYRIRGLAVGHWSLVTAKSLAALRTLEVGQGWQLQSVARFESRPRQEVILDVP